MPSDNERGNSRYNENTIEIEGGGSLITGLQQIVDMFNAFYTETVEELKEQ
jgi:hypothetical protein